VSGRPLSASALARQLGRDRAIANLTVSPEHLAAVADLWEGL